MNLGPRMMLPDTLARFQKKEALANRVEMSSDAEEFAKKKKKAPKDPTFEKKHPRSADGKFGKKDGGSESYKPTDKNDRWMGEWPNIEESKIVKQEYKDKDGRTVTLWSTEFQSPKDPNKKLRVSIKDEHDSAMSDEGKKNTLRTLQYMRTIYPELDTNKVIIGRRERFDKKFGEGAGWGVLGYSNYNKTFPTMNRDKVFINGDMVGKFNKTSKVINSLLPKQWELGKNDATNIVTHELGHQWQHQTGSGNAAKGLFKNSKIKKHLTPYGQTASAEGYAEAFRDWHVSKGKTNNPASLAYAKKEGWFGAEFKRPKKKKSLFGKIKSALPFALEDVNVDEEELDPKNLTKGSYIIVEDLEKGPYVIGEDPEANVEPTQDEIEEADAAAREAYEDLGLDYDKD